MGGETEHSVTDEVTHLRPTALRGGRFGPSARVRPRMGAGARLLRGMLVAKIVLALLALVGIGVVYLRLDSAPLRIAGLSEQIEAALAQRLGPGLTVALADTAVTLHEGTLALSVSGLDLRDAQGALVARAPRAVVGVGLLSLLSGRPTPRSLVLSDVDLRARIARNGSISLVPTPVEEPVEPVADAQAEDAAAEAALDAALGPDVETRSDAVLGALLDPSSPFGALASARLEGARLTLHDEAGRERVALGRVDARIWTTRGGRSVEAQVASPRGTWTLSGALVTDADGARTGDIALTGLPAYDLALMTGLSQRIGAEGLMLHGSAGVTIEPDGSVRRLAVSLSGGAGDLTTRDPFMPRVPIDEAVLDVEWRPREGLVAIDRLAIVGGATRIALAGAIRADDQPGLWHIDLEGRDARVRAAEAGELPVRLDSLAIEGRAGPMGVVLDTVRVQGPGIDVGLGLSFGGEEDRGGLRVSLATRDIATRDALALWPDFVAPIPRLFLRDSMRSGTVRALDVAVALTGADFASLLDQGSIPHEAVEIGFSIEDGVVVLDPRFPALNAVAVTGRVTGRSAEVVASHAVLSQPDRSALVLGAGRMRIPEFWTPEARAETTFEAAGGLDALAALLRTPTLEAAAGVDLSPDDVAGHAHLAVAFALPLNEPFRPEDLPIAASGRLTEVALARLVGEEGLEEGVFDVVVRADGVVEIGGRAHIAGIPAEIALDQRRGGEGEARIALDLDGETLAARGIVPSGRLRGKIPVEIVTSIGGGAPLAARIEAFLGAARIDELVPGLVKEAGVPGRLATRVREDGEGLVLEEIVLDAGNAAMRGSGRLTKEGGLASLELETLRLSPGDDARASLVRENGTVRARMRGRTFDLRPLLARLQAGSNGNGTAAGGKAEALEIDAGVDILTGHRGEVITNASLSARISGDAVQRFDFSGRFPDAPITARLGDGGLLAESADAGATLRFLGIYDNMIGGRLTLQTGPIAARQEGTLIVREFSLRDEPALRRIAGSARVSDGRGGSIDISEATFVKAQVEFVREGGLLTLGDARMWGAQLGFTLSGWVDFPGERLDLAGAFVPAYGLNNAFAQVPVFGRILGGNRYEGLLAINFRVAGPMAEPVLTVNPLSAIAPGVLRNLFGTGTPSLPTAPSLGEAPLAPPLQIAPLR